MGQLFEAGRRDLGLGPYNDAALYKGKLHRKEEGVVHEANSEKVRR